MKWIQRNTKTTVFFICLITCSFFIKCLFALSEQSMEPDKPEEAKKAVTQEETTIRTPVEYKAQDLRDPFQENIEEEPAQVEEQKIEEGKTTQPPPSLVVQGLIWGSDLPQAIINSNVVKIGDTVEGAQIINIDKNGVTILFDGQKHNISSPSAIIAGNYNKPKGGQDEANP